jgi:head-tail adaptor
MSARPFIGAMRHRLQLEAPIDTPDGFGGTERSFVSRGTVTAQLRSYAGTSHRFVVLMRPRSQLSVEMRFRYRKRILQIVSIDRFDRLSSFLRVTCEERQA